MITFWHNGHGYTDSDLIMLAMMILSHCTLPAADAEFPGQLEPLLRVDALEMVFARDLDNAVVPLVTIGPVGILVVLAFNASQRGH